MITEYYTEQELMQEIKKAILDFAQFGASQEELDRAKNWKKANGYDC